MNKKEQENEMNTPVAVFSHACQDPSGAHSQERSCCIQGRRHVDHTRFCWTALPNGCADLPPSPGGADRSSLVHAFSNALPSGCIFYQSDGSGACISVVATEARRPFKGSSTISLSCRYHSSVWVLFFLQKSKVRFACFIIFSKRWLQSFQFFLVSIAFLCH